MTKIVEDLVGDDRIVWNIGGDPGAQFTVTSVLVFPEDWGNPDEVVIRAIDAAGEVRLIDAKYGQEIEVPGW